MSVKARTRSTITGAMKKQGEVGALPAQLRVREIGHGHAGNRPALVAGRIR
jgi:hypothetical protein